MDNEYCTGRKCEDCVPQIVGPAESQPISSEFKTMDGIFIKTMVIKKAGTIVPQHSHTFDHISVVARGAVALYRDKKFAGNYTAPYGISIPARTRHLFLALEDNTAVLCVHDIGDAEYVSIHDEHNILGEHYHITGTL